MIEKRNHLRKLHFDRRKYFKYFNSLLMVLLAVNSWWVRFVNLRITFVWTYLKSMRFLFHFWRGAFWVIQFLLGDVRSAGYEYPSRGYYFNLITFLDWFFISLANDKSDKSFKVTWTNRLPSLWPYYGRYDILILTFCSNTS